MPWTNATVASRINRELGPLAALAFVPDAVAWAAVHPLVGLSLADSSVVTDAELAAITPAKLGAFFDLALWRAIRAVVFSITDEELRRIGVLDTPAKDIRSLWERRLSRQFEWLKAEYNFAVLPLEIGTIDLNFASTPEYPCL